MSHTLDTRYVFSLEMLTIFFDLYYIFNKGDSRDLLSDHSTVQPKWSYTLTDHSTYLFVVIVHGCSQVTFLFFFRECKFTFVLSMN